MCVFSNCGARTFRFSTLTQTTAPLQQLEYISGQVTEWLMQRRCCYVDMAAGDRWTGRSFSSSFHSISFSDVSQSVGIIYLFPNRRVMASLYFPMQCVSNRQKTINIWGFCKSLVLWWVRLRPYCCFGLLTNSKHGVHVRLPENQESIMDNCARCSASNFMSFFSPLSSDWFKPAQD